MDAEILERPNIFVRVINNVKDPASATHRFLALALICLLGFGNYFCYDTPGALEKPIEEAMSVGTSQYTSLYALYSWPNVVMCFFGGVLIDKVLGIRLGAIVFLVLLVIGQLMFAFGAFANQFWMMQLGRFIYGLGGESLSVAQNTYVVSWFMGRELNFVFGFQITVSRAGSALAYYSMVPLYSYARTMYEDRTALGFTLAVASLTCITSFLVSLVLALLDKRAERILNRPVLQPDDVEIRLLDATDFEPEFWMLSIICVSFYLTIFPFIALGSKFFQTKYDYDQGSADQINSIVYIISALTSPLIGFFVDKVGRNLIFLLVAGILVTISHIMLALTYVDLRVALILMGFGYSVMCSALWPLIALAVPQQQLGTAYGVMQAIQNLGLALAANITGAIVDWKGYVMVELFFIFWVAISVVFTLLLMVQNKHNKGSLNQSAEERERLEIASD